jgi:hypothetical protein
MFLANDVGVGVEVERLVGAIVDVVVAAGWDKTCSEMGVWVAVAVRVKA